MRFSLCFLWLCSTVGASPEHLSRLFSTMRCQAVVLFWTLRVRHISFVFWMELYLFTDFFFSQHFFLSFLLFNQYNLLLLKIAIHHIHKWVDKIKCKYTVNSASSSQHSNRMNKERKWSTNLSRSISIGEWLWLCGKLVCNFRHHQSSRLFLWWRIFALRCQIVVDMAFSKHLLRSWQHYSKIYAEKCFIREGIRWKAFALQDTNDVLVDSATTDVELCVFRISFHTEFCVCVSLTQLIKTCCCYLCFQDHIHSRRTIPGLLQGHHQRMDIAD